jgi:4-hydroxybenzoyl-CoA thioesterase
MMTDTSVPTLPWFIRPRAIRFRDCDPAGILFYPHGFAIANDHVEDWFADALSDDFRTMQLADGRGVPTVAISAQFLRPCRIGDVLTLRMGVRRLGRSSVSVEIEALLDGEPHFTVAATLVHSDKRAEPMRAIPWAAAVRDKMTAFQLPDSHPAVLVGD